MNIKNEQYESSEAFISYMQQTASNVLDSLIPDNAEIILLDYPNTTNVGDSLIWLGEIAYLKKRGLKITYVCDTRNYDFKKVKEKINQNSIVLMHGGGNFGTVWHEIHTFRLRVINDLVGVPIIQLPQTIHFDNQDKINEINQALTKHGKFTLIVRSQHCYDFAKEKFKTDVYLSPDMAFFIGAIKSEHKPSIDCLAIARTDHETSGALMSVLKNLQSECALRITDWLGASVAERLTHRVEVNTIVIRSIFDADNTLLIYLWNFLSGLRLNRGVSLICNAHVVITDRLHVHILSILLGKPHVIVDNNYGKLKHFYETWSYRCTLHAYAAEPSEISSKLKELMGASLNEKTIETY